jgi:hypothetical protein
LRDSETDAVSGASNQNHFACEASR